MCECVCAQTMDSVVCLPLVTVAIAVWAEIRWEDLLIHGSVCGYVGVCVYAWSHVSALVGVCVDTNMFTYTFAIISYCALICPSIQSYVIMFHVVFVSS